MRKICIGVPAMMIPEELVNEKGIIIDKEFENDEDLDIWCDFSLEYDSKDETYQLSFETMLGFSEENGCVNWIKCCFDIFTEYMIEHKLDTSVVLNMYDVFTEGINVRTHFKSIEDAYAFMKFCVEGFAGNGLTLD